MSDKKIGDLLGAFKKVLPRDYLVRKAVVDVANAVLAGKDEIRIEQVKLRHSKIILDVEPIIRHALFQNKETLLSDIQDASKDSKIAIKDIF